MLRRYLLPLLLLIAPILSFAETIPATNGYNYGFSWNGGNGPAGNYATMADACSAGAAYYRNAFSTNTSVIGDGCSPVDTGGSIGSCNCGGSDGYKVGWYRNSALTCPSGYTLSGNNCTRPDCPGARNPDGSCMSPCQEVASLLNGTTAWYTVPVGSGQAMGSYCDSGCAVSLGVAGAGYYTDGKNNSFQRTKHYSGASCTSEPNAPTQFTPDQPKPPMPEKKPPCAAGEGVMTSSSGTIACVPEGTPNSKPPVVKKETETKTNPDGTTATTETTTTRDPSTGVEQKTSTTTTKDANGNTTGITSSTGTSGTTNGGNPEKPGDSDFCQKNPSLDICTGKLNKEETQVKIKDALETAFKTDDVKNDDITNAKATDAQKQEATDAGDAIKDKLSNGKDAESSQNAFKDVFTDWFDPIPAGNCSAMQFQIGAYSWSFDPCPQAEKISSLAGYALWIYLAFGTLALVTRKAE